MGHVLFVSQSPSTELEVEQVLRVELELKSIPHRRKGMSDGLGVRRDYLSGTCVGSGKAGGKGVGWETQSK